MTLIYVFKTVQTVHVLLLTLTIQQLGREYCLRMYLYICQG